MKLDIPNFPSEKITTLPAICQRLWALWCAGREASGGSIPPRSAIKGYALGEDAASCFILERSAPRDYKFVMAGTKFDALFGTDLAGKDLTAIAHADGHDLLIAFCEAVLNTPCAGFVRDLMVTSKGEHIMSEGLTLPLTNSEGVLNQVICVSNIQHLGFSGDAAPETTRSDYRQVKAAYFIDLGRGR